MVIKQEACVYTEYKIYPGRGQRFVQRDGKLQFFFSAKVISLWKQKIKNTKLRWTQAWRRMNPFKRKTEDGQKKRTRKAQKFQKAIVGMSLDDLKKKKAAKPQMREEAKQAAAKEKKALQTKKGTATKTAAPKGAPKKDKAAKGGAAPAKNIPKGKR